jgi:hypothetical protein
MSNPVTEELRQEAIKLRTQGKSYPEISGILGLSRSWCAANLKVVRKATDESYAKLSSKAKTKDGVARKEVALELGLYELPEKEHKSKMKSAVEKIRKSDKQNIVRPDWMHPRMALYVTNSVVSQSIEMEERLHEAACSIRQDMLSSLTSEEDIALVPSVSKIKHTICSLTGSALDLRNGSNSRLNNWYMSLYGTANLLDDRNDHVEPSERVTMAQEEFEDLADCMY